MHTATLVGTKIYFLGGLKNYEWVVLNDFFYLDISKSFDKTKGSLPFVNLTDKTLEIPPHFGAATSVFGESKDIIFFFGGEMGGLNDQFRLTYSFSTTQLKWRRVTISQGDMPLRKRTMEAVTDNNDKIYIFGGGFTGVDFPKNYYSNGMIIFDTVNRIWTNGQNGTIGRDGHTATFLPDTGDIIYIGGITHNGNDFELIDVTNLDVYNTISNSWSKLITRNPPEQRYGHTAVLTNDKRIVVFGGGQLNVGLPVKNSYVVLDIKTSEWYHGKDDLSTRAPFRLHTATLYNDYMFIAFGEVYSIYKPFSNDVLIYKIGEYANFTEVNNFIINENTIINVNLRNILLLFSIIIFGVVGFFIFKPYFLPRRIQV